MKPPFDSGQLLSGYPPRRFRTRLANSWICSCRIARRLRGPASPGSLIPETRNWGFFNCSRKAHLPRPDARMNCKPEQRELHHGRFEAILFQRLGRVVGAPPDFTSLIVFDIKIRFTSKPTFSKTRKRRCFTKCARIDRKN